MCMFRNLKKVFFIQTFFYFCRKDCEFFSQSEVRSPFKSNKQLMKKLLKNNLKKIGLICFILICISCEKENKYAKPNKNQILTEGEWFDIKDSTSGISIREDKLAMFNNMQFSSENIYKYSIIDSLKKSENIESKIGEYLFLKSIDSTIINYQIISNKDSILSLKIDKKIKSFQWKKKTLFTEK
jgi:hypothetical protein